jgi:hypothetical protein
MMTSACFSCSCSCSRFGGLVRAESPCSPQALYTFTLGDDSNPLAPAYLTLVSRTRASFVNTSLHFLNGFDYLYDADGGFVGFRWTGHASRGLGKVVPASPSN